MVQLNYSTSHTDYREVSPLLTPPHLTSPHLTYPTPRSTPVLNVRPQRARARSSFTEQLKEVIGLGPEPTDSKWVKLHMNRGEESSEAGEVLMSIELLPRTLANELAAGNGRSEPNDHPQLSPPVGRFDPTQLFNPLYALQQVRR